VVSHAPEHRRSGGPEHCQEFAEGNDSFDISDHMAMSIRPSAAAGFVRTPFDKPLLLHERDEIDAGRNLQPDADAGTRARVARTLARPLGYLELWHGPPYTAWRADETTVFLSMLPGTSPLQPLQSVEMQLAPDRIRLIARWTTDDEVWAPLRAEEYRQSLTGLMADRRCISLGREAALKVLIDRGAQFCFPVVPAAGPPEPLCGWRREGPGGRELSGWDRDPLLENPSFDHLWAVHHGPTRAAIVTYRIQGSWSDEALHDLAQACGTLLPGRQVIRQLYHGCARLAVFLDVVDPIDPRQLRSPHHVNEARSRSIWAVLDRCAAALARMRGRERGLILDPPDPADALPAPDDCARATFHRAEGAMGTAEFVSATDEWTKLHECTSINVRDRLLNPADIRSNDQLVNYVTTRETTAPAE
jgi:hypothetical protein